jgi:hypothetical protein
MPTRRRTYTHHAVLGNATCLLAEQDDGGPDVQHSHDEEEERSNASKNGKDMGVAGHPDEVLREPPSLDVWILPGLVEGRSNIGIIKVRKVGACQRQEAAGDARDKPDE